MKKSSEGSVRPFNTKRSIQNANRNRAKKRSWSFFFDGKEYSWATKSERVDIIRSGIPYGSIEVVGKKLNKTTKWMLEIVGLPQTTYNKKKSEHSLLDKRDSELILLIVELIEYGIEVFNNEEEKFQRWLNNPNISLGGNAPEKMLDTMTGIDEVKFSLNRIESGNLA